MLFHGGQYYFTWVSRVTSQALHYARFARSQNKDLSYLLCISCAIIFTWVSPPKPYARFVRSPNLALHAIQVFSILSIL